MMVKEKKAFTAEIPQDLVRLDITRWLVKSAVRVEKTFASRLYQTLCSFSEERLGGILTSTLSIVFRQKAKKGVYICL